MSRAATGRTNAVIADRRLRVPEMRRDGFTLADIAAVLGVSTATVYRDMEASLLDLRDRSADEIGEWRSVKLWRYREKMDAIDAAIDALQSSPEKLAALFTAWCRVDERESKLLGTDAPTRTQLDHHVQVQPMTEERAREIIAEMDDFESARPS